MTPAYDVLIRNGTVYDGSGDAPFTGDLAVQGDAVVAVGPNAAGSARAALEIDARGLAVAPGFTNMLSWAVVSLIEDGRSQSDVRQGVTLLRPSTPTENAFERAATRTRVFSATFPMILDDYVMRDFVVNFGLVMKTMKDTRNSLGDAFAGLKA